MNDALQPNPRAVSWAKTSGGHSTDEVICAHHNTAAQIRRNEPVTREQRERFEEETLSHGATLASGAGLRAVEEAPDPHRTCFERDRDRIVHSTAFRRLAGKTQVVLYPTDHQRTRLTHALEVAQVATSIARGIGANVSLTDAIALGHDCGHGPGGHASEEAFDAFLRDTGGFDHGPWGADVALAELNLCAQTLDGIRNHSWSRPAPSTIEGEIVSWADRIAYCAHDLEDAFHAHVVSPEDLPDLVVSRLGVARREQLGALIRAVITSTVATGRVSMDASTAEALAALRTFNYEHIYMRQESLQQAYAVIDLLRDLVDFFIDHPDLLPQVYRNRENPVLGAVTYVAGMTDRYALESAESLLGYQPQSLPPGIGHGV